MKITTSSISKLKKRDAYLLDLQLQNTSAITDYAMEGEQATSSFIDYITAVCMVRNGVFIPIILHSKSYSLINKLSYELVSLIVDVDHVGWRWSPLLCQLTHRSYQAISTKAVCRSDQAKAFSPKTFQRF